MVPRSAVLNAEVITETPSDKLSQQWFIERNGKIRNAAVDFVLDISNANLAEGGRLIIYFDSDLRNQEFVIN